MAKDQTATPGTHFRGPLRIEADPDGTAYVTLPASMDDDTGGTADTTDYTLAAVTDTSATDQSGPINNNFATIGALLDAILERLQ